MRSFSKYIRLILLENAERTKLNFGGLRYVVHHLKHAVHSTLKDAREPRKMTMIVMTNNDKENSDDDGDNDDDDDDN